MVLEERVNMKNIHYSSYMRFLNCLNAMDASSAEKKLDAIEGQLLDYVMLGFSQAREILVGDLLVLAHIGSQATLHGRIKHLDKLGFVKLVVDGEDHRKKKVVPTKMAVKHYEKLSTLLELAAAL